MDETQKEILYEARTLEAQLKSIKSELEKIGFMLVELNNAKLAIEHVEKDEETLMPLGGGCLVKAEIIDDKILVPIGGGYLVKMSKKDALEEIERRIKRTNEAADKLREETLKIETRIKALLGKMRGANV